MARLPTAEEIRNSADPIRLNDPEWEVARFVYEKHRDGNESAGAVIDVVLQHSKGRERVQYRFVGVELEYLPPLQSPYPIVVMNAGIRGWEVPRSLKISVSEDHPDTGPIFWAADVECVH